MTGGTRPEKIPAGGKEDSPRQKAAHGRPNRAKKPAGRATAAKKYSCKTCEKGGRPDYGKDSAGQTDRKSGRQAEGFSRNGWRRMGRAVKKCQPDRSKFSILVARMFLTKGLQVPALAVTIGRASENVGQAKGLDQNGWRHTARKNSGRGQGRFTAAKERHTAGRIERKEPGRPQKI